MQLKPTCEYVSPRTREVRLLSQEPFCGSQSGTPGDNWNDSDDNVHDYGSN